MAADTDDITVDLDALDKPAPDVDVVVEPEKPEKTAETAAPAARETLSPEDGLKKLQKQLEDERKATAAAEARARSAETEALEAKTDSHDNRLAVVTSAIASTTQAMDTLEQKLAEAHSVQDYAAVAKLQREMAANSVKLDKFEQTKIALERAPKPALRPQVDPVEAFASQLKPASRDWIRAHPEYVTDAAKNRKMIAAHEMTMADGVVGDSPEYFASVERYLGMQRAADPDMRTDDSALSGASTPAAKGRQVAPAAAPVSRSGNGTGKRPGTITLTAAQVEMAKNMGQTPAEYAKELMAIEKERTH
jgi:hypothetical protein